MSVSAALFRPQTRRSTTDPTRADRTPDAGDDSAKSYSRVLDLTPARTDICVPLSHMPKECCEVASGGRAEAAHRGQLSQSPANATSTPIEAIAEPDRPNAESNTTHRDTAGSLIDSGTFSAELNALEIAGLAGRDNDYYGPCALIVVMVSGAELLFARPDVQP
jgi:hypothetical protein